MLLSLCHLSFGSVVLYWGGFSSGEEGGKQVEVNKRKCADEFQRGCQPGSASWRLSAWTKVSIPFEWQ